MPNLPKQKCLFLSMLKMSYLLTLKKVKSSKFHENLNGKSLCPGGMLLLNLKICYCNKPYSFHTENCVWHLHKFSWITVRLSWIPQNWFSSKILQLNDAKSIQTKMFVRSKAELVFVNDKNAISFEPLNQSFNFKKVQS